MKLFAAALSALILSLALLASACARSALRYGEPIEYAGQTIRQLPDFSIRFLGVSHKIVHVGEPPGRDFDFGSSDFEISRDEKKIVVGWQEGTGTIAPAYFEIGGKQFVLELVYSQLAAADKASIRSGTLLIWPRPEFEKRLQQARGR